MSQGPWDANESQGREDLGGCLSADLVTSVSIWKWDSIEGVRRIKEVTQQMNYASVYHCGGGDWKRRAQCICGLAVIYDIAFGGSLLETGCERKGSI